MVVGAFPAAKLGSLLLKQISKPIANAVKTQAKNSPVFRKYVCMPPAQFYNWCEIKAKMWILNLGKPVNIPVLNEAMAIELGANLLGEGIIFLIAAGIIISEYNRSANKEYAKEEAKAQEVNYLQNSIRELFIQTEEQAAKLREMTRKIADLETQLVTTNNPSKPDKPKPTSNKQIKSDSFILSSVSNKDQFIPPDCHSSTQNFILEQQVLDNSSYQHNSIILNAVNDIEDQFWSSSYIQEEDSILFLSLYHIQDLLKLRH